MKTSEMEENLNDLVSKYFPYPSFRPFQLNAIKFAYNIIVEGEIGLLSSPCGTGKSISVLTAYLAARENDPAVGRLLVLTRTKNQLEIYSRELKNIKEKSRTEITASIFKSKKEMCPYALEDPNLEGISYRDFLQYCKGLKSGIFGGSCKYYDRTYSNGGWKPSWLTRNLIEKIRRLGPIMPDDVYTLCRKMEVCPYEITRILARHSDIIIGNYNYILVEAVRGSTLGRAGVRISNVNCIFDEAHSLPYYASGILSDELSLRSVRRAIREIERFGLEDLGILDSLYDVMVELGKMVYRIYGPDVEHIIKRDNLINILSEKTGIENNGLAEAIEELAFLGEIVRQKRVEAGKSPVSYLSRCASFLMDWFNLAGSSRVGYIKVEENSEEKRNVRLGIKCLDPSLLTSIINETRSAILMSGTLWNMDYYIDVLGLNRDRCRNLELPSPFPSENRLILVDMAVTTRFEERSEGQWIKIAERLNQIIQAIKGRVAVYFPSYDVMHEIMKYTRLNIPMLIERKDTKIVDALSFLRENSECAIFGVARGKMSEGVDMSIEGRSMLSAVIIVGLPFPKKTELQLALQEYFAEKFGDKAVEYSSNIPCLNALAQSAGRLLRDPKDRGIIVIMDRRAAGRFKNRLPEDWRRNMKAHIKIENIIKRINAFVSEEKNSSQ